MMKIFALLFLYLSVIETPVFSSDAVMVKPGFITLNVKLGTLRVAVKIQPEDHVKAIKKQVIDEMKKKNPLLDLDISFLVMINKGQELRDDKPISFYALAGGTEVLLIEEKANLEYLNIAVAEPKNVEIEQKLRLCDDINDLFRELFIDEHKTSLTIKAESTSNTSTTSKVATPTPPKASAETASAQKTINLKFGGQRAIINFHPEQTVESLKKTMQEMFGMGSEFTLVNAGKIFQPELPLSFYALQESSDIMVIGGNPNPQLLANPPKIISKDMPSTQAAPAQKLAPTRVQKLFFTTPEEEPLIQLNIAKMATTQHVKQSSSNSSQSFGDVAGDYAEDPIYMHRIHKAKRFIRNLPNFNEIKELNDSGKFLLKAIMVATDIETLFDYRLPPDTFVELLCALQQKGYIINKMPRDALQVDHIWEKANLIFNKKNPNTIEKWFVDHNTYFDHLMSLIASKIIGAYYFGDITNRGFNNDMLDKQQLEQIKEALETFHGKANWEKMLRKYESANDDTNTMPFSVKIGESFTHEFFVGDKKFSLNFSRGDQYVVKLSKMDMIIDIKNTVFVQAFKKHFPDARFSAFELLELAQNFELSFNIGSMNIEDFTEEQTPCLKKIGGKLSQYSSLEDFHRFLGEVFFGKKFNGVEVRLPQDNLNWHTILTTDEKQQFDQKSPVEQKNFAQKIKRALKIEKEAQDLCGRGGLSYNNQDNDQAFYYWYMASQKGDPGAKNNLGHLFSTGYGHRRENFAIANYYFYQSTLLGNYQGMNNLGSNYVNGQGAPKSLYWGKIYIKRAVDGGFDGASQNWKIIKDRQAPGDDYRGPEINFVKQIYLK